MILKVNIQQWVLKYDQVCSNDDPVLILTYFTARSNLVPYAFVWEKYNIVALCSLIWMYTVKILLDGMGLHCVFGCPSSCMKAGLGIT